MQVFIGIINFLTFLGVWIVLVWFANSFRTLKDATEGLKNTGETVKNIMDAVKGFQQISSGLYDPEEIEKFVSIKSALARDEAERQMTELKAEQASVEKELQEGRVNAETALAEAYAKYEKNIVEYASLYSMFTILAVLMLNDTQVNNILDSLRKQDLPKFEALDSLATATMKNRGSITSTFRKV